MNGLLDYVDGDSFLYRLNPLMKLLLAFTLCAVCFISDKLLFVLGVIIVNLCLSATAGLVSRTFRVMLSLLKLSIVLFLVQIFFVREGTILLTLPLNIYITDRGLLFSLLFVTRLIAATMPLTLILSVTKMTDISNALTQKLHIPYKYTFVLTTAIRFIPLFAAEMAGIIEAQVARGVEFDTKNFFKKIKLILPLCVPLLISSVRKIEGGAISAELRGFNLRKRDSAYKHYPFTARDAAVFCLCVILVAAALYV
ncbi:MAG: energy-coupling factor transporter transmembrane protein EcfT [Treponema sp.]|jgi:energy-coupling factor transport system permease protein|nr:energy-coupling factor transporter transmembrane protein EcfT [Treponema sp.]